MLYAVKVETKPYEGTRWFLVIANSIEEARAICTDEFSTVVDVTPAIETVVRQEYDSCAMLETL